MGPGLPESSPVLLLDYRPGAWRVKRQEIVESSIATIGSDLGNESDRVVPIQIDGQRNLTGPRTGANRYDVCT